MSKKIEHKLVVGSPVEVKFDAETGVISGYASVFNGVDSYGDTIVKGAYEETLRDRERPVKMRWNHFGPVIGKWTKIEEDDKGLWVEGQLTPGHSVAGDVLASLKHGAFDGLSIGYRVMDDEENDSGGRTLKAIDLVEVSVVEEPADLNARVADVKSAISEAKSLGELEDVLRDAGMSRSTATALVSRVKALVQGDPESEPKAAAIAATFQQYQSIFEEQSL